MSVTYHKCDYCHTIYTKEPCKGHCNIRCHNRKRDGVAVTKKPVYELTCSLCKGRFPSNLKGVRFCKGGCGEKDHSRKTPRPSGSFGRMTQEEKAKAYNERWLKKEK